jgi:CheY-like chemotaxis protein
MPVVLVVDDDALSRHVLVRRLLRWGYDPVACTGASEALSALSHGDVAAVVADIEMPGTDGIALAAEARRIAPAVPVFLVTGTADPGLWPRAAAAGARDVLVKQAGGGAGLRQALALALRPDLAGRDDLVLAHSLRTPLTALKGAIDILCSGQAGELPESQRRFAGIAQRNVDRMIALVEELLESTARP